MVRDPCVVGGGVSPDELAVRIADHCGGAVENVLVFSEVDSTQAMAQRLIEQLDEEAVEIRPVLVVARRQRLGAGRGGRRWRSPDGGLYLTLLRSDLDADTIARMPMLAATAAARAVCALGFDRLRLKWPNDLLVDGGKLGGLVVHARHGEIRWCAVGLGVNVRDTPSLGDDLARYPPTSLADHLGDAPLDERLVNLAAGFARALGDAIAAPAAAIERWRELLVHTVGEPLRVRLSAGEIVAGTLVAITDAGHLRLQIGDTTREITAGDVIE